MFAVILLGGVLSAARGRKQCISIWRMTLYTMFLFDLVCGMAVKGYAKQGTAVFLSLVMITMANPTRRQQCG